MPKSLLTIFFIKINITVNSLTHFCKKQFMKIIFLDIDGTISTVKTHFRYFEKDCLDRLKTIIDATNAKIVISSSWRLGNSLEELKRLFLKQGDISKKLKNPIPFDPSMIIGVTPIYNTQDEQKIRTKLNNNSLYGRGLEICGWLQSNLANIESYAVIDDDIADIPPHLHRHIKTHSHYGLNDDDITKTIKILEQKVSNEDILFKLY